MRHAWDAEENIFTISVNENEMLVIGVFCFYIGFHINPHRYFIFPARFTNLIHTTISK